jgi:pimeloyl-ACP methyl ester carboxylesterase
VAAHLRAKGLGTLLIDLLTAAEDEQPDYRFDIELLASRLVQATVWVQEYPLSRQLPIGYFGASTGAAAALRAAAEPDNPVYAVVSRGGRPDLAARTLGLVRAPTLLVVGSRDGTVLGYNKRALRQLNPRSRLQVIEGATHLFEEPGALEAVARMAGGWFLDHLPD